MSYKVIFIRHGESIANVDPKYYAYPDPVIVLSEKGVNQCIDLSYKFKNRFKDELHNATFVSSKLSRARSTADIATMRLDNVDVHRDERINECPTILSATDEMESFDSVRKRVRGCIDSFPNTNLFLFTHGELMWCVDPTTRIPENCEIREYDRAALIKNYLSDTNHRRIWTGK